MKRVDFSLNFSVDNIPDDVDIDELTVFGDFLMQDESGFARQIQAEEHTLEIWGEDEAD